MKQEILTSSTLTSSAEHFLHLKKKKETLPYITPHFSLSKQ